MDTLENNKLIATFMGWKEMSHTKSKNWMLSHVVDGKEYAIREKSLSAMRFVESWDWLMPVVEKIESLNENGFDVTIYSDPQVKIDDWRNRKEIVRISKDHGIGSKIEAIYMAVIEFITWYNQQNV